MKCKVLLLALILLVATTCAAQLRIGVLSTGTYTSEYWSRLTSLGHQVEILDPPYSAAMFMEQDILVLTVGHAQGFYFDEMAAISGLLLDAVEAGVGLYVSQPNPIFLENPSSVIPWVPYHLELDPYYELGVDVVVAMEHCLTENMPNSHMPFPADTVVGAAAEWSILAESTEDDPNPSLMHCTFGEGQVLLELEHIMGTPDAMLERYVTCLVGGPVAVESWTWSDVKGLFNQ